MIKELSELHDHVGVADVWDVVRGVHLVVHLRNGPWVWYPEGVTSSARLLNSILIHLLILTLNVHVLIISFIIFV